MLADKLNMTPEEAERWIVNLIRNARLDAKIDSKLVRRRSATGSPIPAQIPNNMRRLRRRPRAPSNPWDFTWAASAGLDHFTPLQTCVSPGSRGDGQQRRVAVPAGDREDEESVLPQPDVGHEHREEDGAQQQERGRC